MLHCIEVRETWKLASEKDTSLLGKIHRRGNEQGCTQGFMSARHNNFQYDI